MNVIAAILQAFFEQLEIDPATIREVEIAPGLFDQWWIHVQPEQPWFASVSYHAGQWWVTLFDYVDLRSAF